jgi:hypothetical protein
MLDTWFGHYLKNEDSRQDYHRIDHRWFYIVTNIKKIFSHWNNCWRHSNLYTFIDNFCNFKIFKLRQFFSFYAGHSEELINISLNAYGNWDFLGTVNEFTITYPSDPPIRHIGFFNSHLITGYSDNKKVKDNAIKISIGHLNNIKNITKEFESGLYEIIQTTGFKDNNKKSRNEEDKYYYPDIIAIEVFREIQNQINNTPRKLNPNTSKNTIIYAHFETDSDRMLLSNKYEYSKIDEHFSEFQNVINTLTNDKGLKEIVNRYNLELSKFHSIQEGIEFQNFVRQLYDNIVNQTTHELEGSCRWCKLKKLISI